MFDCFINVMPPDNGATVITVLRFNSSLIELAEQGCLEYKISNWRSFG